ncbi:hypothetical protein SKAU_G00004870 [Synaphobranchus kaupii]|uniref:Ectonucleoside triphosphate diphosphohydrolase 2 n=1 Tax=Synaphobranchus kaupii TaxID=118154 RepID=A0A9Q1JCY8_SYNKA|nr:hypothetical protein SKAU_G00004870 [Synaphobranchus kaupii]
MGKQRCQIIAPVALLLLGILGILLLTIPTNDMKQPPEYMYGIVLDAGSSHTTMYMYKWPADKQNDTGIVTQHSGMSRSTMGTIVLTSSKLQENVQSVS